jgi:GDP-L-fucose synthase
MINLKKEKIWITGHNGMVGKALCSQLIDLDLVTASSKELDLRDENAVTNFVQYHKPTVVFNLAAKVGGIQANQTRPVEFLLDNLKIQNNVIQAAETTDVKKLIFLGSACTYPKMADQPIPEEALFTGEIEPTNIWYATAKLAGIKLAQAMLFENRLNSLIVMPANSYGPGDNFSGIDSHVIPALLKKIHNAKIQNLPFVEMWGSGTPKREFLYVDDLARALVFLCETYDSDQIINIGSGDEISIHELTKTICEVVGFKGDIKLDPSKPDGAPRKLLNSTKLTSQGWRATTSLIQGLERTYKWALDNKSL